MEDEAPVTPETREPETGDIADKIAIEELPQDERAETARAYLAKRMQLLDLEVEHFDLKRKGEVLRQEGEVLHLRSERLQRRSERLKIAMQVLLIVAGFAIVGGFGAMMWWASRSEIVVVEAFDVPPGLAQKGDSGRVVASAFCSTNSTSCKRSPAARPANWR